ncbi:Hsp20/alpha crystallin family protein [Cytobacillus sp. IB215665]|uniref:Hsp20/alpha crystallin family protein n=1 Tax=Cytobacillus sp. IB215665 TaxID=3097357 RepID=UPI002A183012|nr:Hsp20/alpha crystallin family protein [Cytobacillus sp. IB215665]MDX8364019.1 Hsp20/alpha crystallin family protein [Cytobacillus sp. IB215665]
MTLIPHDPFRHLSNMRRDMDRLFSNFSNFPFDFTNEQNYLGMIRVDVYETSNEVVATCDIPGLEKKEDVNIEIDNNVLNISGSINRTDDVKDENLYRRERHTGSFHRAVTLPTSVSIEGVKATYKNGVLEVTMPKKSQGTKKKINVDFH